MVLHSKKVIWYDIENYRKHKSKIAKDTGASNLENKSPRYTPYTTDIPSPNFRHLCQLLRRGEDVLILGFRFDLPHAKVCP